VSSRSVMLTPGTVFCASGSSRDSHGSSYGAPPTSASKLVHARDLRFAPPTPKRPLKSMVFEPCSIWPGDCEPRCPDRGSGSALDPEHHAVLGRTQNLTDSVANVKTAGGTNALPNPVPGSSEGFDNTPFGADALVSAGVECRTQPTRAGFDLSSCTRAVSSLPSGRHARCRE